MPEDRSQPSEPPKSPPTEEPKAPARDTLPGGFSLGALADDLLDGVERLRSEAAEAIEPSLRLGVTGLSGAGKTVFITALTLSLLERDRMRRFGPAAKGRIAAAMLRPQPDDDVARFGLESHTAALRADPPAWSESTRSVSQIRVSLRLAESGFFETLTSPLVGPRVVNLDIVDYPGEWLLDLPLMEQDYETWSAAALSDAARPARAAAAAGWHAALGAADPAAPHSEAAAAALAEGWAGYLAACRAAGLSTLAPGRFLMPGDYAGSPALSFAPLPRPEAAAGRAPGTLWHEMRRRFEAYKRGIVQPFFRRHFARLDRQVVLVDALTALSRGPQALADMTEGLSSILGAFRHGRPGWLDRLIGQARIDRILVAATKADRLHHSQHPQMTALIEAMLAEAVRRAAFSGAEVRAMALASVRSTAEQEVDRPEGAIPMVRGRRLDDGREVALHPGALPADPVALLSGATATAGETWEDGGYASVVFRPPRWGTGGPPHIRLDSALDFLIGDRLG